MPLRTSDRFYLVNPDIIGYLRYTVESYDGAAVLSTVAPRQGLVRLSVARGCEDVLENLLADLVERDGLLIREVDESTAWEIQALDAGKG